MSNFHFQVNEMLGGRSVSQWAERWMGAPPLAAGKYTRVMCHWSAEWMWPATAAMRGLFLSRYSSEEIYDQRPEDGGAAGDGVKFFRFFSPPVDLFLQWTKKKCTKKGKPKRFACRPRDWRDARCLVGHQKHPRRSSRLSSLWPQNWMSADGQSADRDFLVG